MPLASTTRDRIENLLAANRVVLLAAGGVGPDGVPVNTGEANGAPPALVFAWNELQP